MSDSTRLALIEGRVTGMAEHLDLLAAVVQDVEARAATAARGRLEARLGVAVEAAPEGGDRTQRVGSAGLRMPNSPSEERSIANTIGNVVPVPGLSNLLDEPGFDGASRSAITLTTSLQTISYGAEPVITFPNASWVALKTAGTAATCTAVQGAPRENEVVSTFNSARLDLRITPTGSGTHEIRVDSLAQSIEFLPEGANYLVGSIRVCSFFAQTLTNVTGRSLVVELYDATDAVVRGTTTVNLPDTVDDTVVEAARIWCSLNLTTITGAQRDHPYQLRIRLIVVSSGAGGDVTYSFGEPQTHLAYSPDPISYAPMIAAFTPQGMMRTNAAATTDRFLSSKLFADTVVRFAIDADGRLQWGPGNAALDTLLYRSGTSQLTTDGELRVGASISISPGGYFHVAEIADPGNAGSDMGLLFFVDNGAGKTQLIVRFSTGAGIVLATQA